MEIVKLVGVGIIICVIALLLKSIKPEVSVMVTIVGSAIMIMYILNYFTDIFNTFYSILSNSGINNEIFWLVIKIIGVSYLVEFGASIASDSGVSSIADKIILGGKVIIFIMSMPIITTLFNIIMELIN